MKETNTTKIKITNLEFHDDLEADEIYIAPNGFPFDINHKPAKIEKWYDRHLRHWVIYPVDVENVQLCEAVYEFSKADADQKVRELEERYHVK